MQVTVSWLFHYVPLIYYGYSSYFTTALGVTNTPLANFIMATIDIISTLPNEMLGRIFLLLSDCKADISACRLTCRQFHHIISSFFVTSVAIPTNLHALQKLQNVLKYPTLFHQVREIIYIETYCEWYDEDNYENAFEVADWDEMEDEDKALWQDLSCYSDYPKEGPEKFRHADPAKPDDDSLSMPDFSDYIFAIRVNTLEEMLRHLPKLRDVVLLDYCSACTEGLIKYDLEDEYYESRPMWPWKSYDTGNDFHSLISMLGRTNKHGVTSISVGPYSFKNSTKYWEERRNRNVVINGKEMSHHIQLDSLDYVWATKSGEQTDIIRGLCQLRVPFVIDEYGSLESVEKTSIPLFVGLSAPTLTHLVLDAKGLILDEDRPTEVGRLGNLGRLAFDEFFGKLSFPRLVHFDLRGWSYAQNDMEHFLTRHANTLRELSLVDNVLLLGQEITLNDFASNQMSLLKVEIRDRAVER